MKKHLQFLFTLSSVAISFSILTTQSYAFHGGGGFHGGGFHGGGFHNGGNFHGGFHGGVQGFQENRFQGNRNFNQTSGFHNNMQNNFQQHNFTNHQNFYNPNHVANGVSDHAGITYAHGQNVSTFANHNFNMNPHPGIPNNAVRNMNNNVNKNWTQNNFNNNTRNNWNNNNNWHNNNWNGNNNWHNNWNGNNNWNWHNNWNWNNNWHGWNNWGWGSGWNNGWVYSAFLGATVGALFIPYYWYSQPSVDIDNGDYLPSSSTYPQSSTYPEPANYPQSSDINDDNTDLQNSTPTDASTPALSDNETWMTESNGYVPKNAVVNNNDNGKTTYYCRAQYMNQMVYGVLVPHDGCYVQDQSVTMRFTVYDTLVTKSDY